MDSYKCPKCNSLKTRKKGVRANKRRIFCNDCGLTSSVEIENFDRVGIERASETAELDLQNVKHGWIKTKTSSLFFKNPGFEEIEFDIDSIDWKSILKNVELPKAKTFSKIVGYGLFDRLVYTDTHVGMNPNPDGYSLYGGKWDEDELMSRLEMLLRHTIDNRKSNVLIVDDLGDFCDGWDAKTVRREHDLPQNMDNQKVFDVGLRFKYQMYIELSKYFDKLIFNNICRSNHSTAFDYVINSAFKNMVELTDKTTEVNNHRKFINHYSFENYTFVISHGKDDVNLKFGFKSQLDSKGMEKIDRYIDVNYLLQKGVKIEFSKGDSHQLLFDWSTSDRFNYFNYLAFSPASSWVQVNFKKSKSGFCHFNYLDENTCNFNPFFFDWKK